MANDDFQHQLRFAVQLSSS